MSGRAAATYSTDEQKNHYLPRLARVDPLLYAVAKQVRCAIPDRDCLHGRIAGQQVLRISDLEQTLHYAGAIATVGLAFKTLRPEKLLSG